MNDAVYLTGTGTTVVPLDDRFSDFLPIVEWSNYADQPYSVVGDAYIPGSMWHTRLRKVPFALAFSYAPLALWTPTRRA